MGGLVEKWVAEYKEGWQSDKRQLSRQKWGLNKRAWQLSKTEEWINTLESWLCGFVYKEMGGSIPSCHFSFPG